MESKPTERGAKPRNNRNGQQTQQHRIARRVPPRTRNDKQNIYITLRTDFKAQQKRCEDILNAGAKEIYLHCMGYSITRGLNLALKLVQNSDGALSYAINTSTIELVDELHPISDDDDIAYRARKNSALHIKIFNTSLFNIVVPKLPPQPISASTKGYSKHQYSQRKQEESNKPNQK